MVKLELVRIGNVNNVEGLANILGCRVSSLPLKYLGLSVGFRNVGAKHFPPCKANLDHLCNAGIGNVNNVEGLANILGCRVSSLPLSWELRLRPNLFGIALLRR
jgi:hypothetical protein